MKQIFETIEKNFGIFLLISTIFSFIFPQYFLWGENITDELLMTVLFLGCLKINFSDIFQIKVNIGKMVYFVLLNIILLPIVFYGVSFNLDQEIRIGIFLLLATSGAVVTPLLASFLGLKILWSTVFVIITSLLIPLTLPLLIKLLFGISIKVSVSEMILFLSKIVIVPAVLAVCVSRLFPKFIKSIFSFSGFLGSLSIAIFMAIFVALNINFLKNNLFHFSTLPVLFLLFLLLFFRFLLGFLMPFNDPAERWTNSLMFGNVNVGLILLLAAKFLTTKIVFVILLSEIPWVLAQPIFQKLVYKFHTSKSVVIKRGI